MLSPEMTDALGTVAVAKRLPSLPASPAYCRPVQVMVAVVELVHDACAWNAVLFITVIVAKALASPPVVNSFGSLVHDTSGVVSLERLIHLVAFCPVTLLKPKMLRTYVEPIVTSMLCVV